MLEWDWAFSMPKSQKKKKKKKKNQVFPFGNGVDVILVDQFHLDHFL